MLTGYSMRLRRIVVVSIILTTLVVVPASKAAPSVPPALPHVWHILFSSRADPVYLRQLKTIGFDTMFKCVAGGPAHLAAEWRLVEQVEGQYDWSDLRRCLEATLAANLWVVPEIVINVPPNWFLDRYPDALLKDSRGMTVTNPNESGAPFLLSPWFVATGVADPYLSAYVAAFLEVVDDYPHVVGIMIGNFKLNVLPWKLGTNDVDNFTFWPVHDSAAIASYRARFGPNTLPPATWGDYEALSLVARADFRDWLTGAIRMNLQTRYLPWLAGFAGWKVVTASIWNDDGVKESIFTTGTPEMTEAKQAAIAAADVPYVVINDDNMGDCGLAARHQQDITLAQSNGFQIVGERVPGICTWASVFNMWQAFSPRPVAFINLGDDGEIEPAWVAQFRSLYGPTSEPLPMRLYLPLQGR